VHKKEIAQSISAQHNKGIFKNLNLIQSIKYYATVAKTLSSLESDELTMY